MLRIATEITATVAVTKQKATKKERGNAVVKEKAMNLVGNNQRKKNQPSRDKKGYVETFYHQPNSPEWVI